MPNRKIEMGAANGRKRTETRLPRTQKVRRQPRILCGSGKDYIGCRAFLKRRDKKKFRNRAFLKQRDKKKFGNRAFLKQRDKKKFGNHAFLKQWDKKKSRNRAFLKQWDKKNIGKAAAIPCAAFQQVTRRRFASGGSTESGRCPVRGIRLQ